MFVPHLEGFDFFMALITGGFSLRYDFFGRKGKAETETKREEKKDGYQKKLLFEHNNSFPFLPAGSIFEPPIIINREGYVLFIHFIHFERV
jgi:hypothetical protein